YGNRVERRRGDGASVCVLSLIGGCHVGDAPEIAAACVTCCIGVVATPLRRCATTNGGIVAPSSRAFDSTTSAGISTLTGTYLAPSPNGSSPASTAIPAAIASTAPTTVDQPPSAM